MADPARDLPPHVTTPLLSLVTQQALEEDYRQVAERKGSSGIPPDPPKVRAIAVAVIAAFGILVSVAAVQNSRNEAVEDAGRATLIARIGEERALLRSQQDRVADLTRENQQLADDVDARTASRQQAETQLTRLQASAGFAPVTGEGVRIVVDGNPNGDERQQVTDADLAILVDGLFAAGAEAIAINDQRLNNLGSIRNTGPAVHVNTRPLSPPYTVRAIGDTQTLQAELLNTTHGAEFFSLADQLGFVYSMQNVEQLTLPAARQRPLRQVSRAGEEAAPGIEEGPQ
ncbi:DUF881 domain-containing protein [Nocardioides euryhalodurans]|uniref:DUF881 domain-containing protein n=1 Tax=Nocardioides euryhalodurans TaxID=2518370 RepID=A0A4P7GHI5_9ACTN|nr:DUF881 domain-containing protein [Nocardioides euryhalodurans]QBR91243.1 DUF881 domain-containing protein [Nocardioides euryhalodurans]